MATLVLSFAACKKNDFASKQVGNSDLKSAYEAKILFSETLAKALKAELSVRIFLKEEALKKFDNDYDVVYFIKKDVVLGDGQTLHQKMLKYTSQKELFEKNVERYPLMSIYVPVLPDFTAESWNTSMEIPLVAVEPDRLNRQVKIITSEGERLEIPYNAVPAVPAVVVKENERIIIETAKANEYYSRLMKGSDTPEFYIEKGGKRFLFLAPAFNGITRLKSMAARTIPQSSVDAKILTAYTNGSEWQRDYIYYNITPTSPNGAFSGQFREFVKSFKFFNMSVSEFQQIADQVGDPKLSTNPFDPPYWVEGAFEFKMDVLINAKNGVGQILGKVFSANGGDMLTPTYKVTNFGIDVYTVTGFTANEFHPVNLEITGWDLEQYGSVWKFIMTEHDPDQTTTRTVTNTSTYGGNFGFDAAFGTTVKFGPKFGASSTTTETNTFTITTTLGSDDLGSGLLDFRDPVLVSGPTGVGNNYQTYEVTTGKLSFSVEPQRIY